MTANEKIKLLDEARQKVEELDKRKKEIYEETRAKIGLSEDRDNDIWDFVVLGMRLPRSVIQVALHTNEGKNA